MLRMLFWLTVYLVTLGLLNINVRYKDGLTIKFRSWSTVLRNRKRKT